MEPMTPVGLAKPIVSSLLGKLFEKILPTEFTKSLDKAVEEWVKELPADLRLSLEPRSVLRGLKPEFQREEQQGEAACWAQIHDLLFDKTIPKQSDWYDALQLRWGYVAVTNEDPEAIFRVESTALKSLLESLAHKLEAASANHDAIFRPTIARAVSAISSKIDDLGQTIKDSESPHNVSLNHVKDLLDRHQQDAAKVILDSLESAWGELTPWQQYRTTALRANAVFKDGEYEKAGRLFIRAKSFQPNYEIAIINEAVGYELILDVTKAHELATQARREYPDSAHALAVWLRTLPDKSSIVSVVKSIPAALLKDQEVLAAIVLLSTQVEQTEVAVTYGRRLEEASRDWPPGILAYADAVFMAGFKATTRGERDPLLRNAIAVYTRAIDLARSQNDRQTESMATLNRGLVREFIGEPGAKEDYEAAAILRPDNPLITRQRDLLLLQRNDYDKAIELARNGYATAPRPDTALFLAISLGERKGPGDVEEAIALSTGVAKDATAGACSLESLTLAVALLAGQKNEKAAVELIQTCEPHHSPIAIATIRSILRKELGDLADARTAADDAYGLFTAKDSRTDRHRLAMQLVNLEMHNKAALVFKTLVRHGLFDFDMKMLMVCAHKADNDQLLLIAMEELRQAGVRDRYLLHNEVALLRRYNPEKAGLILTALIHESPSNKFAQLYRSLVGLQLRRDDYICTDPSLLPSVSDGDPTNTGRFVVAVLIEAGKLEEAIRFAYEMLRIHLDDVNAHRAYMYVFYHRRIREGHLAILESSATVGVGCAVDVMELVGGQRYWIVIEDNLPIHERLDEYSSTHPLAQAVMGKKVGEVFDLTASDIQPRQAKVLGIVSKYVRLYNYCLTNFQIQFKSEHDIQMFHVPQVGSGDDARPDFSAIESMLKRSHDRAEQVLAMYPAQPVPLHKLAEFLGRELYEVLAGLCEMRDKRIICCIGTIEEREDALNVLLHTTDFVIDATAFFTLVLVDRIGILERWPAHPIMSPATLQLIESYVNDRVENPQTMTLALDRRGRMTVVRADPTAVRETTERFTNALAIIKRSCKVVPCEKLASIDPEKRRFFVEWFGQDGAESAVLASEPGRLLWTDDQVLAMFSKGEFGIQRVWTQVTLQAAVYQKALQQSEMDRDSARLFGAGYGYTFWNADVLLCAASMVNWDLESPLLTKFIDAFSDGGVAFEVRFAFAVRSVIQFYQSPASGPTKNRFVVRVLDAISLHSERRKIYGLMRHYIERMCQDNPQLVWDLLTVAKIWLNARDLFDKPLDLRPVNETFGEVPIS